MNQITKAINFLDLINIFMKDRIKKTVSRIKQSDRNLMILKKEKIVIRNPQTIMYSKIISKYQIEKSNKIRKNNKIKKKSNLKISKIKGIEANNKILKIDEIINRKNKNKGLIHKTYNRTYS